MTLDEMDRLVAEWVNSDAGKAALVATERAARKAAEKILDDARVDPEQLRIPCRSLFKGQR